MIGAIAAAPHTISSDVTFDDIRGSSEARAGRKNAGASTSVLQLPAASRCRKEPVRHLAAGPVENEGNTTRNPADFNLP